MQLPLCTLQVSNDTRQNHLYSHLNNDHRSSLRSHTGTSSKDEPACAGKQLNVFEDLLESRSPTWKCHHIKSDVTCSWAGRSTRLLISLGLTFFARRESGLESETKTYSFTSGPRSPTKGASYSQEGIWPGTMKRGHICWPRGSDLHRLGRTLEMLGLISLQDEKFGMDLQGLWYLFPHDAILKLAVKFPSSEDTTMVVGSGLESWNSPCSLCAMHTNGYTPKEMLEAMNINVHDLRKQIGARRKPRVIFEVIRDYSHVCQWWYAWRDVRSAECRSGIGMLVAYWPLEWDDLHGLIPPGNFERKTSFHFGSPFVSQPVTSEFLSTSSMT